MVYFENAFRWSFFHRNLKMQGPSCKICVFVGFSSIFLLGILIFKGLTARRLYNSLGVKWLRTKYALGIKNVCGKSLLRSRMALLTDQQNCGDHNNKRVK
jgi:hypothetical protein